MSVNESGTTISVEALQRAFDGTFAEASRAGTTAHENLLAITIGGDPYAVRLSDVGGLYSERKVTRLPGSVPQLLGLVGLRGALLPAYDLAALLGYPRAASPRWYLIAAAAPFVLGFEQFDGHLRVARDAISAAGNGPVTDRSGCIREIVHGDDLVRPLVHAPSVLEAIVVLAQRASRPKE